MSILAESLKHRLLKIKVVLIDNDGVLTDGRIVYGDYGDELKFFDVQDGFGMTLLRRAGFPVIIVSGKKCRINHRRAKELSVNKIYQNMFWAMFYNVVGIPIAAGVFYYTSGWLLSPIIAG